MKHFYVFLLAAIATLSYGFEASAQQNQYYGEQYATIENDPQPSYRYAQHQQYEQQQYKQPEYQQQGSVYQEPQADTNNDPYVDPYAQYHDNDEGYGNAYGTSDDSIDDYMNSY